MSNRVPRSVRWLVTLAAALVPGHRREVWHRQWSAEIEHRCREGGATTGLLRFAMGSVTHALYLRREEMTMRGYWADLRHSARGLLRRPGFSFLAVATLAIGIGTATAIYSLAEAMVLRPMPLPDGDRLVRMFSSNPSRGMPSFSVSYPDYVDLVEESGMFDASTLYIELDRDISGGGDPERIRTIGVHEDYFQTLGSSMVLGRPFSTDDHNPANEITIVLAESFWAGRFGSDSTIVGQAVRLDGVPHTVVGVVGSDQGWPARADVWVPFQWGGVVPEWADARSNHTWQVVGRLSGDVAIRDASEIVRERARAIYSGADIDPRDQSTEAFLLSLRASAGGESPAQVFATLGTAVFLVLLIACMNASGLLLTRAWARTRELSLRAALGAGRGRLVFTLMGESLVLSLLGGALGVGLGTWLLRRGLAMAPPEIQAISDIRLNSSVLMATLGISVLAALMAGLLPALKGTRASLSESLKDGSGQAGQGRASTRLRQALIVGELAFSLALLVGAGMTVRGFNRQMQADPGFEAEGLISFAIRLPRARYGEDVLSEEFYRQAIERMERHPGIVAVTATSKLPLGATGVSLYRSFIFDGATPPPEGVEYPALWVEIDPSYFETVGVRMASGRAITSEDDESAPFVAVVNERMAARMSPDESLLGRQIRSYWDENLPRTVIGVVRDIQFGGISRAQRSAVVFVPRAQAPRLEMTFLVRTAGDASEMLPVVRQTMTELDPDVALDQLQSLKDAHAADLAGIRFVTTLFGSFGFLALILSVSGVYGLVSYSVSRRTQEIGVRMAMGATAGTVRSAVLRESAALAVVGLGLGLGLAYVAGRVLAAGLDGIAMMEASTFAGVAFLLATSVVAATWVPSTRATRVDPVEALRSE